MPHHAFLAFLLIYPLLQLLKWVYSQHPVSQKIFIPPFPPATHKSCHVTPLNQGLGSAVVFTSPPLHRSRGINGLKIISSSNRSNQHIRPYLGGIGRSRGAAMARVEYYNLQILTNISVRRLYMATLEHCRTMRECFQRHDQKAIRWQREWQWQ